MRYEVGKIYNWRYFDVRHHLCHAQVRLAEVLDPARGSVRVETLSSPGFFIIVVPSCLEELPASARAGRRRALAGQGRSE